jgi:hypothetical protein
MTISNAFQVAKFTAKDVDRLLKNDGIIKHRGKIEAMINNAKYVKIYADNAVVLIIDTFAINHWHENPIFSLDCCTC